MGFRASRVDSLRRFPTGKHLGKVSRNARREGRLDTRSGLAVRSAVIRLCLEEAAPCGGGCPTGRRAAEPRIEKHGLRALRDALPAKLRYRGAHLVGNLPLLAQRRDQRLRL